MPNPTEELTPWVGLRGSRYSKSSHEQTNHGVAFALAILLLIASPILHRLCLGNKRPSKPRNHFPKTAPKCPEPGPVESTLRIRVAPRTPIGTDFRLQLPTIREAPYEKESDAEQGPVNREVTPNGRHTVSPTSSSPAPAFRSQSPHHRSSPPAGP